MAPPHADDLTVAAVAWLCSGNITQARMLLDRALALDPHQDMAAKALSRLDPVLPPKAVDALRWHAETDPDSITTLLAHVRATHEPVAYVRRRLTHCILPPGIWRVSLRWQHLVLAEIQLGPSDEIRQIALPIPERLRGIVAPVVCINDVEIRHGRIAAEMLAAPRLQALISVDDDGTLQVQPMDRAAPGRPVALQLRAGDQVISGFVSSPVTALGVTGFGEIPPLAVKTPPNAPGTALCFELTGEPVMVEAGADDGIVDVVVPVHGDEAATRACFQALLSHDPGTPMRVVVIEDASPEPGIVRLLEELAGQRRIALIRNPGNLGFVRSVNIGMAAHSGRDVVLLNADTVVAPGWLARLRKAACRETGTGTVTPWSNDATICSYPAANSPTPLTGLDIGALDRLVARTLPDATCPIPTAVGFCMYIRRACLAQTGWFDADAFGTGYGEENDFCLRASALGWRHLIALDVFVGHIGGGSFGAAKQARINAALAVLESRYPGYDADIQAFIAANPLRDARQRLDMAQVSGSGQRPLLILCADLGGGTNRFIQQVIAARPGSGGDTVILRPEKGESTGSSRLRLELPNRPDLTNLIYDTQADIETLRQDLIHLGVTEMELHHAARLPAALLPVLASWFPYRAYVHDYGWICPRYNLVDGTGRYCGEPAVQECDRCVATHGDLMEVGMPVSQWRMLTRPILAAALSVGCSCQSTANRMRRYVPEARYAVSPAEPVALPTHLPFPPRAAGEALRLVVPGAIGAVKGYDVLLACAADAKRRSLPLRFQVLGYSMDDDALAATGRVDIIGQYEEDEVPALLAQLRPHAAFLPSVWPETWCYALTHVITAGLFVAAFDLGAQAERLRAAGRGLLLPPLLDAGAINDALLRHCP